MGLGGGCKSFQAAVEQVSGDHRQHSDTARASHTSLRQYGPWTSPLRSRAHARARLTAEESPADPITQQTGQACRCAGKKGARAKTCLWTPEKV